MLPSSILPDRSAPAVAGTLVTADAKPGPAQALGTLFSLAQRGILVIEESPEKRWYRPHEFAIRMVDPAPRALRPHEKELLDLLFTTKAGRTDAIKLSEAGTRLTTRLSRFSQPLTEELRTGGLIDGERQATANRFMIIGVGLLLMMIPLGALAVVLMSRTGAWPFLLVAVAFLLGIAAFVLAGAYSPLSDEGERQAARWRGFEKYLKDVTKGREPAWDLKLFDEYLPYAAAFGLTEGWAKVFQKRGGARSSVVSISRRRAGWRRGRARCHDVRGTSCRRQRNRRCGRRRCGWRRGQRRRMTVDRRHPGPQDDWSVTWLPAPYTGSTGNAARSSACSGRLGGSPM